ncbi:MarR family winged helix-turn-helix transcriptional regulator [Vannielia litorea]|uniref:DNA-binding transcriptional regulator, MarR family n=1 Tax=Vannielia litorea TaxID=1217970 RepID=A0A1N6DYG6_9RHOB|nr:MarR family transcriptional regulator [Vannielia litorea]SIN75754.1 DNA-binding transcriptional regulator, MarR family [Vannielia litorea]
MTDPAKIDPERIRERRSHEDLNVFSRLPAVYAASRRQGQQFLQFGGGISIMEWRVLWDLCEAGPMTIRDLATIQRADHSLLSRALPEMKRKGFVTMHRAQRDKRQTIVEATTEGRAAYELAAPVMARRRAALREALTEEETRRFIDLLDRVEMFLNTPAAEILQKDMAE